MIKKIITIFVIFFFTCIFITIPVSASKSYYAERYDVILDIQPDGSLIVTETIVFRFEGGPFTFVFREISNNELDQVDRLNASMDGYKLPQGTNAGQVEIEISHPIKVTWHFQPINDSTHEFQLVYRVLGAIRKDPDVDTLIWRVIPEDHDYRILHSLIRLEYPENLTPSIPPSLEGFTIQGEPIDQGMVFLLQNLEENVLVKLNVSFKAGSLVNQMPEWQTIQAMKTSRNNKNIPYGIGAAVVLGIASLAGLVSLGHRLRREAFIPHDPFQRITTPPENIAPALAGYLTRSGMGFLGTLFDLSRRGLLSIEEAPKHWGSRSYEIKRQPNHEILRPHESLFLEELFKNSKNDKVPLDTIASLATSSNYIHAVEQEVIASGWVDLERKTDRSRFLVVTILEMISGIIFFFGGILLLTVSPATSEPSAFLGAILVGGGTILALVGLIGIIMAAVVSTLSDEGVRQAAAWNSFAGYLRQITRGKEQHVSPNIFDVYLPFAAAFGIATEWAKFFQKTGGVPVPEWFQGFQEGLDDGSFIAIMAAISAADSSASVSSGGDGGGGSGGGASGAG